jgi:hypothetical protein
MTIFHAMWPKILIFIIACSVVAEAVAQVKVPP